jgi:hypothetical protein
LIWEIAMTESNILFKHLESQFKKLESLDSDKHLEQMKLISKLLNLGHLELKEYANLASLLTKQHLKTQEEKIREEDDKRLDEEIKRIQEEIKKQ